MNREDLMLTTLTEDLMLAALIKKQCHHAFSTWKTKTATEIQMKKKSMQKE